MHGIEFAAFYTTAADLYPYRELNASYINHVLSTHINDVRLKNLIELRHWDSLPIERAELLTQIVSNLFYDVERRERLESYFSGLTDLYPDRELNAYEINHVLSTHFNDVRLKNFIEMRHWDSLPIERAELLTQIVSNLFYDVERRERLESYFSGLTGEDVHAAKAVLQARGGEAKPYDQPMDYWAEVLGVGDALADVPGDAKWPEVAAKAVLQARGGEAKPYDQPMDYWAEVLGVGDALADVPGDAKWPEVRQESRAAGARGRGEALRPADGLLGRSAGRGGCACRCAGRREVAGGAAGVRLLSGANYS